MSRVQQYQSNFTVGEIDPLLRGRIDLQQYYGSVDTATNVVFEPQGGFSRRPGLRFVKDCTTNNPNGMSRLIPFQFSTTQRFMLLISQFNNSGTPRRLRLSIFNNQVITENLQLNGVNVTSGGQTDTTYISFEYDSGLYNPANPGSNGGFYPDFSKFYFTQNADTLILTHESIRPIRIARLDANNNWSISYQTSDNFPKFRYTATTTNGNVNLTPSAVSGNITLTCASSFWTTSMVDQFVVVNNGFGRARITERVSATVAKATVEIPFFNTDTIDANDWEVETGYEAAFSSTRGYPSACTFHEGRLYYGGAPQAPNTLFGSKVGNINDFSIAEGLDDDAIIATLSTDQQNAITGLRSGRDLQIFTTGGEFYIPQGELQPITPKNISIKGVTARGAEPGIMPTAVDSGTLFIQRGGKSLREFLFTDAELSYVSNNISLLCSHMIIDPARMVLRKATDTTEGDLLLILNGSDSAGYRAASTGKTGTISAFMLNRGQQIVAPATWRTDGEFVDVGVDLDTIYVVVKRTIGGATKYYLETFDEDRTTDSSIQYLDNPTSPDQARPTNRTYTGLTHLEGETVKLIIDDIMGNDSTVSSGQIATSIAFPNPTTYAEVGLNYTVTVKTMPFEPRLPSGTIQSHRRRILEVSPVLYRSQNITLNGREISLQTLPASGSGAVPTFTGVKKTQGFLGYDRDAQITISQNQPVFFTVLALDYKVSIGR